MWLVCHAISKRDCCRFLLRSLSCNVATYNCSLSCNEQLYFVEKLRSFNFKFHKVSADSPLRTPVRAHVRWSPQMAAEMMKNLSPEMLQSMGEQAGLKMTPEQAEKAAEAMKGLSEKDIQTMVRNDRCL